MLSERHPMRREQKQAEREIRREGKSFVYGVRSLSKRSRNTVIQATQIL
jgi:hypothetical protein